MEENNTNEKKHVNLIGKLLGKKDEGEFNAERAWIESTYGEGSYKDTQTRIKEKQSYIKNCVENKYKAIYANGTHSYSSYHCVIDIEEDLTSSIDIIFEPFVKNGFDIINLSDRIKEINEPNVYLLSWKNAFSKSLTAKNEKNTLIED